MLCRSCSFVAPSRRELTRPQTVIRVLRMQARPPHTPGVFCTQLLVVFRFADIGRTSFDRIVPGSWSAFWVRRFSLSYAVGSLWSPRRQHRPTYGLPRLCQTWLTRSADTCQQKWLER